ncbi:GTP-binding protein GEM-like [Mizuhopecten yessoensis]|uniref:GTP-binding protein GEM n=1 Tax=Mizuhopecten yessoensis TaxID=6573 RepID=A0A210Q3L8_MIZYE|nr:GTP-binding protein GEM-like [Mizuhopecten yessoensis]OWF43337.1 GTP-binding protein GEM [Mizuhopecten yessoensis]
MTTDTIEEEATQGEPIMDSSSQKSVDIIFPEIAALKRQMLDFERGAMSAPNSRSTSFKNRPRPKGLRFKLAEPRRNSLPVGNDDMLAQCMSYSDINDSDETIERVRSFKMTSKGIENRGDSFRRKSNSSIASAGSAKMTDRDQSCDQKRQRIPSDTSDGSTTGCSCASSSSTGYYRVLVIGDTGVGKSALANQFMTSEYMVNLDITSDELEGSGTVSVLLEGEESTLEFIDSDDVDQGDQGNLNFDAYLAVFSVDSRASFDTAVEMLNQLRDTQGMDRAMILVANKIDLVRRRMVSSEEAKRMAEHFHSKYAETSVTLNHNVDELLVGVLRQIRLKLDPEVVDKSEASIADGQGRRKSKGARGLLSRLFRKSSKQSSSCEDLYDL